MAELKWDNIFNFLNTYTQFKHYQILFDKYRFTKKHSREEMIKILHNAVTDEGFLGPEISNTAFQEWLSLHQIDGNNYTYVYNLVDKANFEGILELYRKRQELIELNLSELNVNSESEDFSNVMPELNDIKLIGIHHNDTQGSYTFSFVAPCIVTGSRTDGSSRFYKKLFFCHCVLFENTNDLKIIFNPTSNLQNVNGIKKDRNDWSPIANMFFNKIKEYIGEFYIRAPLWIPEALYNFAEEATRHNNPDIIAHSFNASKKIIKFSEQVLKDTGIDIDTESALLNRFVQDIQMSFEAQLMETYGTGEEVGDSFTIFKQRSDGFTHIISVESTGEGFKTGSAAQAAKRSRQDGDIDLLGINLRTNNRVYKFLVEQGTDAYLIRGTNTFIEEEVVNIVIRKLNVYREQIQAAANQNR